MDEKKRPAHRPNKTPGIKRINFNCRVNPATKEYARAYALALGITLGEFVDLLVMEYKGKNDDT